MENLKECPFCGSDEVIVRKLMKQLNGEWVVRWEVWCWSCDAKGSSMSSEEAAVERWNTRAIGEKGK